MQGYHEPVLLRELIEALKVKRGSWYLDCTFGDGGHSLEILKRGGNVLGIDVDPQAIDRTRRRLGELEGLGGLGEYELVQGNFRDAKNLINEQTDTRGLNFAGAIFDLGVSSLQLENSERGFSFAKEGPLDMRMDPNLEVQALDLVSGLNKGELYELFSKLGEEKFARALAEALVSARKIGGISRAFLPLTRDVGFSTRDLAELVEKVYRKHGIRTWKIHPATRVFQALRIAVNDELNALKEGLDQVKEKLDKNGRIVVISFHSLEDRIVKDTFKRWNNAGLGGMVTKKPIIPSDQEIRENPRSRSAKMRVFEVKDDNY